MATKKARRLIDKKKYYGVKSAEKQYRKLIFETFYDPNLINSLLSEHLAFIQKEDFNDVVYNYFAEINKRIGELLEQAKEILMDSFEKGSKRVLDKEGGVVKFDEITDTEAIDTLINKQVDYYEGISEAQSKKVNEIIADGLDKGQSPEKISDEISSSIRSISSKRAMRISKTEIVKSHVLGQVQTMKSAEIATYNYITENDSKVSKICKHNQGPKGREKIYQVQYAGTPDNPLPVINSHPNCRCTVVINDRGEDD
jgi:SPP1 gp7 family putative phage head morphogenesis protein